MGFDPYNCFLKIRESIGTPIPKVGVHLGMCGFIPSHSPTPRNIRCDSQASFLARTLASLYPGREPKAKVATSKAQPKWCTLKLLDRLNYKSKGENNGRIRSWGIFPGSQHFGGRGACWRHEMGTKTNDKWVNYSHGPTQTKQQVG
jgi:hypothetical protein